MPVLVPSEARTTCCTWTFSSASLLSTSLYRTTGPYTSPTMAALVSRLSPDRSQAPVIQSVPGSRTSPGSPATNEPLRVVDEKGKPIKYTILAKAGYTAPREVE